MDDNSINDAQRKRFLWGIGLTCALSIPFLIGVLNAFKGLPERTAIGLGAITANLAEVYATFGLLLAIVLPVVAIGLLLKSFSRDHPMRTLFSVFCICWSALMLAFAGLFVWLVFHATGH